MDRNAVNLGLLGLAEQDAAYQETLDAQNSFEQVAYLESVGYMRNQLLRDTDWVSMAHSLEIRVPLVNSLLTESVVGLAATSRPGTGKSMLYQALKKDLPRVVINRPKTGFTVPTWRWLRHHPGLEVWGRTDTVSKATQPHIEDFRRWAYMLLARYAGMDLFMR